MVRLEHVHKRFFPDSAREVHALNDVSITFEAGDYAVLTGPSGSGKTTMLNLIGCLDGISEGEITIDGKTLSSLDEAALSDIRLHDIGFVFQAYNLIPVLSVYENIAFVMNLRGDDKTAIEARVHEVAKILQIDDFLDSMPNQLSGGQQQRVAVARAVASRPKIILADEPTANLDSKNSEHLMAMMKQLNVLEKITVIFSSHDDYVVEQARRIITLHDGKVVDDRSAP